MSTRWAALGVIGFAVWLIATFGVVYAAIELAEDDSSQAIVIGRTPAEKTFLANSGIIDFCVSYNVAGTVDEWCEVTSVPPACYLDAEIGKRLPDSCQ